MTVKRKTIAKKEASAGDFKKFRTKREVEGSLTRALVNAAKKHQSTNSALDILQHAYDYAKERDLQDGKYIERAIYTAMSNLRDAL